MPSYCSSALRSTARSISSRLAFLPDRPISRASRGRKTPEHLSMNVGAAQIDITPQVGCELSGYAARVQPSVGVLDRLFAKAIYLQNESARLLWLQADVIAID